MTIQMREAILEDLPQILQMLMDDVLGSGRESTGEDPAPCYKNM